MLRVCRGAGSDDGDTRGVPHSRDLHDLQRGFLDHVRVYEAVSGPQAGGRLGGVCYVSGTENTTTCFMLLLRGGMGGGFLAIMLISLPSVPCYSCVAVSGMIVGGILTVWKGRLRVDGFDIHD